MPESRHQSPDQERAGLTRRRRWMRALLAPVLRLLARLLFATYRLQMVRGAQHLNEMAAAERAMLLCCWHQRLPYSVGWLVKTRRRGLRPGFLVSPSRDGEWVAAVLGRLGLTILRGSANRTGARALRDMYATLQSGISPIMAVDGPHGPAGEVKSGTLMLASMSKAPLLPLSCAADRYWQLGSWDRMIIPKPFARLVVCVGEPMHCRRGVAAEQEATRLKAQLEALTRTAEQEIAAEPR